MTQSTDFGRLETVPVRTAWVHEASAFTPWLAENLVRLSEALCIPLELVGTEVRVTRFAADIMARNVADGSTVLIENQLEESDHGHLGQIMTYLAGTEAKTVVWIAPRFYDAHISAIHWLNEHTADPFSFFAVEVRVVRIGNSPLAPVFEVIERPNDWERTIQEQARANRQLSSAGEFRKSFWTHFLAHYPSEQAGGPASGTPSRWRSPTTRGLVVAQYLGQSNVGVFIRAGRSVPPDAALRELEPYQDELEHALSAPIHEKNLFFIKYLPIDSSDRGNWDRMSDWLHEQADAYVAALERVVGGADLSAVADADRERVSGGAIAE
jgi:hypothetical protein